MALVAAGVQIELREQRAVEGRGLLLGRVACADDAEDEAPLQMWAMSTTSGVSSFDTSNDSNKLSKFVGSGNSAEELAATHSRQIVESGSIPRSDQSSERSDADERILSFLSFAAIPHSPARPI